MRRATAPLPLQQAISAFIVLVGMASAWAQDFVAPLVNPFETSAPGFEPVAPSWELPAPLQQFATPTHTPFAPAPEAPLAQRYSLSASSPPPVGLATQSTWYGRIDYFQWHETIGGQNFVTETGPLTTLGYLRQVGRQRFRGELFGGDVNYSGFAQFFDGSVVPLHSATNYIGLRGEYDLLFQPPSWSNSTLLVGVGTRFWFRDLPDARTESGAPVSGYLETWWTTYPYLGLLRSHKLANDAFDFYTSYRAGFTAVTFEHVSWNDAALYPKIGFTGQFEAGFRGSHFFASAFSELLTWGQSDVQRDLLQPASSLLTIGLRAGVTF